MARFEREAIAAARITHPNVAAATDFGRLSDGACYLVLEYVQGKSLRQVLTQLAPFETSRALRIAKQIALALGAAHEAGVVHRDLKPENVMLVEGLADPDYVKVLDFGIAKIHTPEQEGQPALTRMGTIFGTPEYMSPEQALGQSADSRTDLYSLGIIMYEMLTGRTPFADKELVAVLTRQMTEIAPPLPAECNPSIVALVSHLLAKRPSERPQTAQEVATRIDTVLTVGPNIQNALGRGDSSPSNGYESHCDSSGIVLNVASNFKRGRAKYSETVFATLAAQKSSDWKSPCSPSNNPAVRYGVGCGCAPVAGHFSGSSSQPASISLGFVSGGNRRAPSCLYQRSTNCSRSFAQARKTRRSTLRCAS